jgi:uncharacterized protein (DUF1015 family)
VARPTLDGLQRKLEVFFDVREWQCDTPGLWNQLDKSLAQDQDVKLVLFGLTRDKLQVLRVKDHAAFTSMMPYFHSELYRKLEVSVIDHVVLDNLLALSHEMERVNLSYAYDRQDAVNRVLRGEYQLVFLLTPIGAGVIRAIADLGEKMPKKSTYFFPKVPAGLLLHRLA